MADEYPTIVVLSNDINADGTLREDIRRRVDGAIVLYNAGLTDILTMSGKCTTLKDGKMEVNITQAEAMKKYAVSHGILEESILLDEKSVATVGQAYCVKRGIIVPRNWGRFAVLTSDYHMERTRQIFDFIFGPNFDIGYISVPTDHFNDFEMAIAEKRRLQAFFDFWKGIKAGDDTAITEAMHTRFPFYKGRTWEEL